MGLVVFFANGGCKKPDSVGIFGGCDPIVWLQPPPPHPVPQSKPGKGKLREGLCEPYMRVPLFALV